MGTFPSEQQVKDSILQVAPSAAQKSKALDGSWLTNRDILDFDAFAALTHLLKEICERERIDITAGLCAEYGITDEEKETFSHCLVSIKQVFERFCLPSRTTKRKVVTKSHAVMILRECGLAPRNVNQKSVMNSMAAEEADDDGNVDFKALLRIATRIREDDRQWLYAVFQMYDGDSSGGLGLSEVQAALAKCGVRPRTQHEIQEVKALINEYDEDGSGEVDHEEFVEMFRFVSQKLHTVQREVERQTAVRYNWTDAHFDEVRAAFMALDHNASESLEYAEMLEAVETFQHSCDRGDVNKFIQEAGVSANSQVDFLGFMRILKALEDREEQRQIAEMYGFEGEAWTRLRFAFQNLDPDEEGLVPRDKLRPLLMDGQDKPDQEEIKKEIQSNNLKIGFEVFARLMKKKLDAGAARRA